MQNKNKKRRLQSDVDEQTIIQSISRPKKDKKKSLTVTSVSLHIQLCFLVVLFIKPGRLLRVTKHRPKKKEKRERRSEREGGKKGVLIDAV